MKRIVLRCATQKLFNEVSDSSKAWQRKLSTAVTYCYEDNQYKFWTYTNQNDLLCYLNDNYIIGFNNILFDSSLILGEKYHMNDDGSVTDGKNAWKNYDLYIEIKKRILRCCNKTIKETLDIMKKSFSLHNRGVYTLENIVIATVGERLKNKSDPDTVELYKQKKIIELLQRNLQETRITKHLYDFIKKYKYVINGNYDIIKFKE
jgi:hypothetical protein